MKPSPVFTATIELAEGALPSRLTPRARVARYVYFIYVRAVANLTRMQWPQRLALVFWIGTAVLWISIWRLDALAVETAANTTVLYRQNTLAAPVSTSAKIQPPLAPPEGQFLKDLTTLFETAKSSGISVGTVDYKREPHVTPHIVSHQVDLHVTDDYPRMKRFLASVLARLPHAVLHDLRIERRDALSPQASMLVRLSLMYEGDESAASVHP